MKTLTVITLSLALFLLVNNLAFAETILVGPVKGADVSATMGFQSDLSVAIKNRSDNSTVSAIDFGSVPALTEGKVAPQYIEVSYACNYGPNPPVWGMDIYTDNVNSTSGYAKGGLIHNDSNSIRIVMCYSTYDDLQSGISDPVGPPISDPWIYIVDKNDTDDPNTQDQTDWDYLLQINYPRFVYGFGNGDSFLQMDGTRCTSPVYIYPAGLFKDSAGGTYSTTLYIDLYHL